MENVRLERDLALGTPQLLQGGSPQCLQQHKPEGPLNPAVPMVQAQMGEFMSQHRGHGMHVHAQQVEHGKVIADDVVVAVHLAGKGIGLAAVNQDQRSFGFGHSCNAGFNRIDKPHLVGIHPLENSPVARAQYLLRFIAFGEGPDLPGIIGKTCGRAAVAVKRKGKAYH